MTLSTVARDTHSIAQTRELESTKRVLPQVLARGINKLRTVAVNLSSMQDMLFYTGLDVREVAHDVQLQVSSYVTKTLKTT